MCQHWMPDTKLVGDGALIYLLTNDGESLIQAKAVSVDTLKSML